MAAPRSAMRTSESSAPSSTIEQAAPLNLPSGTLRLRAEPVQRRHIQWAEDVVDNEGMGKKSSKVCCIYHKQREFGESSDESSDSSSSDDDDDDDVSSDSDADNSSARPSRSSGRARPQHHHPHGHGHGHGHNHSHDDGPSSSGPSKGRRPARKRSPNAYEKMPNYNKKKGNDH